LAKFGVARELLAMAVRGSRFSRRAPLNLGTLFPMHIPDGFVDVKTAVTASALAVAGLGYALHQVRRELPPRKVPLLGLGAAFVFAAQMVNFPVVGGTSGHLIGGALIAALLGVPAAVVVMATVLIAQCFLFADGGVTALGANVFNMAVVAPVVGGAVFRCVRRLIPGVRGQVAAVAFAGWCSTVAASLACAGQLAWSGTVAWSVAFPAMTGIHLLIGLGEGAISALVFSAVARSRPELTTGVAATAPRGIVAYGLLASLGVALFVAPFACPWPDGLEAVAAKLGFEHAAREPMAAPMADYLLPGVGNEGVATALAGLVGALVVFGAAVLFSRILVRREPDAAKSVG
jgi:cobalt/nickel transport system permease protein